MSVHPFFPLAAALLSAGLVVVCAAASSREIAALCRRIPRWAWATLAGVLLVECLVNQAWVPDTILHSYEHGFQRLAHLRQDPLIRWHDPKHGAGYAAVVGLPHALAGGVLTPFQVAHGVGLMSVVLTFLVGFQLSERPRIAVGAATVLALSPLHLRVVSTTSLFVPVELGMVLAVFAAGLAATNPGRAPLGLACAALALAMQTRVELLLVAPATVLLLAVTLHRRWLVQRLREPWLPLGLLGVVLLTIPHAAAWVELIGLERAISTAVGGGHPAAGSSVFGWVTDGDHAGGRAMRQLIGILMATAVLSYRGVIDRVLAEGHPLRQVLGRFGLLLTAAVVYTWVRSLPLHYAGVDLPVGGAGSGLYALHAGFNPNHQPWLFLAAGLVGSCWLVWRQPATATFLVGASMLVFGLYGGHFDSLSTYLRSSLAFMWLGSIGVSYGLMTVARFLPAGAGRVWLWWVLLVVAAGQWVFYGERLRYEHPMQQELRLMDLARATGQQVRHLADTDLDTKVPRRWLHTAKRRHTHLSMRRQAIPLGAPGTGVGDLYLRGPACYRLLGPDPMALPRLAAAGVPAEVVLLDGRLFAVGTKTYPGDAMRHSPDAGRSGLDLDAQLPCWDDPASQVCGDDREPCRWWTCVPGTTHEATGGAGYLDPACAAFEASHELEPIATEPAARGNLSPAEMQVVASDAVFGVYRVVGVREPPPDPSIQP